MTINEFRAWFDGYCDAVGATPTPEQWAKLKAKVAALPHGTMGCGPFKIGDAIPQMPWVSSPNLKPLIATCSVSAPAIPPGTYLT